VKKLIFALIIFSSLCLVQAQTGEGEDDTSVMNDEQSSSTVTDEIISTEPITISAIEQTNSGDTEGEKEVKDPTPNTDMVASFESSFSRNKKVLNIPLMYRFRNYSLSATVPYIIEKKVGIFDMGEMKIKEYSTSGLGDISFGVSYGNLYEPWKLFYDISLSAKAPTGDPEAYEKDEFGSKHIIPLGTDTWDVTTALSLYKFEDNATFKAKLLYAYNGSLEDVTDYTTPNFNSLGDTIYVKTTTTTSQGGQLIGVFGLDYKWKYRIGFSTDISFGLAMDGEFETKTENTYTGPNNIASNKNTTKTDIYGMTFSDIRQSVSYSISLFEFVLGVKAPLFTTSNDDDITNLQRNSSVFLRTNYRIF